MTFVSHTIIAACIASKFPNPVVAGALSLTTHLLCDTIPHWDLGTNWRNRPKSHTGIYAIIETFIAVGGTFLVFYRFVPSVFTLIVAIVFSLLPDWLEVPYYIFSKNNLLHKLSYYFYKAQSLIHSRLQLPWGIVTQVVTVALFLIAGFWFH